MCDEAEEQTFLRHSNFATFECLFVIINNILFKNKDKFVFLYKIKISIISRPKWLLIRMEWTLNQVKILLVNKICCFDYLQFCLDTTTDEIFLVLRDEANKPSFMQLPWGNSWCKSQAYWGCRGEEEFI